MAKKDDAPAFPVGELVANAYPLFEIPRHVAVGAMSLAGKAEDQVMTVDEFKQAVDAFLARAV